MKRYLPYNKNLKERAKKNRANPTIAEKKIWFEMLSNKRFLGLKFTRQKTIENYIVDFYCSKLKLVIEIDGSTHASQIEYDKKRTKDLKKLGITVYRYWNNDVMCNLSGLYIDLRNKILKLMLDTPQTPLTKRGIYFTSSMFICHTKTLLLSLLFYILFEL